VERCSDADLMALYLNGFGLRSTTINGDRFQCERELALNEFRSGITPILVATDVCARGLDIKNLDFVINVDLPKDIETFVHR
jgi:ATP-dependent RNA helicase DDX3X